MIKKIAILIISCLLFLSSCSENSVTYTNKEIINMNYNNINNHCRYWLTTDSICFLEDDFIQNYFLVEKSTKTKIGTNGGYGDGNIQRYKEKIYMLHTSKYIGEHNNEYELKCYDVKTKKTVKLCNIKNCENYLVLDRVIYYLEYNWVGETKALKLKSFSIDSKKHTKISDDIVSFGVINNSLYYVAEDGDKAIIYMYDAENCQSVKKGDFSAEYFADETAFDFTASYTQNYIFFWCTDYKTETTKILKYFFDNNSISQKTLDGCIDGFVSYDNNSYFIILSDAYEKSELCKLNNATDEIIKITECMGDLFVGSDNGVYVLKNNDRNLMYYSNEGKSKIVYHF